MATKRTSNASDSGSHIASDSDSMSTGSRSPSASGSISNSMSGSESIIRSGSSSGSASDSSVSGSERGSASDSQSGNSVRQSGASSSEVISRQPKAKQKKKNITSAPKKKALGPKKRKVAASIQEKAQEEKNQDADDEADHQQASKTKKQNTVRNPQMESESKRLSQDEDEQEVTFASATQIHRSSKKLVEEDEEDEEMEGLTEVEKEKRLLEKYEAEEKRQKETQLRKRLNASLKDESQINIEDESSEEEEGAVDTISSRRGRKKDGDRRKEALSNLKANKSKHQTGSMLRNRLGDKFDSDDSEFGRDDSRHALAEKRRKRQELLHRRAGEDDDSFSDEMDEYQQTSQRSKKKSTAKSAEGVKNELLENNASLAAMEPIVEKPEDVLPADWGQAHRYLLKRRSFFEKFFYEPYFDKLVRGVYVRIPIGEKDGDTVYRFCEVVHVSKLPRPYKFAGEMTQKGITCAFGKSRIEWRLNAVSTHSLQESEFLLWRATLNKDRMKFPTYGEVRKVYQSKIDLISKYQYSEKEVDEMVQRKNASGVGSSKVPLGVQRVRLERDIKAAREMKNFEKAIMLEAKLQRLLNENEARQSRKSDDVLRITEINRRNREANLKQDLQAQELNDAMREKMTSAEKLQFIRANSKKMFLSRDKIEANLAQGKLVKLADGRIMTLNKVHEIEALPEDLVRNNTNQNSVLECEIGQDGRPTGKIEIDVDRLLAKQRERKKKEIKDKADMETKETKVEFVGPAPTNVAEMADATIRIQDDDGSWMTLRPASEILRQMREKSKVSTELKASRKGLTVKEYFDRVKRQRVQAPTGADD
ncbi:hypothetical protein ABG067_006023 [Albugo candida]